MKYNCLEDSWPGLVHLLAQRDFTFNGGQLALIMGKKNKWSIHVEPHVHATIYFNDGPGRRVKNFTCQIKGRLCFSSSRWVTQLHVAGSPSLHVNRPQVFYKHGQLCIFSCCFSQQFVLFA